MKTTQPECECNTRYIGTRWKYSWPRRLRIGHAKRVVFARSM